MPYEILETFDEQVPEQPQAQPKESNILGMLKAGAGGFAGVPRNVIDMIKGVRESSTQAARKAFLTPEQQQMAQQSPGEKLVGGAFGAAQKVLPQTETVKESLGYQQPTDKYEQAAHQFAEDIGSMLFPFPGSGGRKIATQALRAAGISGAGNAAKFLTQEISGDQSLAEKVKLGTMLITSFGLQDKPRQQAERMYQQLDELVPSAQPISSSPIRNLSQMIEDKYSGIGDIGSPGKQAMNDVLRRMERISSGPRTDLKELIAFKKDAPARWKEFAKLDKTAQHWLGRLEEGISNSLKKNPDVPKDISRLLTDADEIWSGMSKTNRAIKYMKSLTPIAKLAGGATGAAGVLGAVLFPEQAKKAGMGALGAAALSSPVIGYNVMKDIIQKPALRSAYTNMMASALKENAANTVRYAKRFNKEADNALSKGKSGRYEILETF